MNGKVKPKLIELATIFSIDPDYSVQTRSLVGWLCLESWNYLSNHTDIDNFHLFNSWSIEVADLSSLCFRFPWTPSSLFMIEMEVQERISTACKILVSNNDYKMATEIYIS